ncbi:hypothetical protein BgiMline_012824, partial [Biomphalaria glabrata]
NGPDIFQITLALWSDSDSLTELDDGRFGPDRFSPSPVRYGKIVDAVVKKAPSAPRTAGETKSLT